MENKRLVILWSIEHKTVLDENKNVTEMQKHKITINESQTNIVGKILSVVH